MPRAALRAGGVPVEVSEQIALVTYPPHVYPPLRDRPMPGKNDTWRADIMGTACELPRCEKCGVFPVDLANQHGNQRWVFHFCRHCRSKM